MKNLFHPMKILDWPAIIQLGKMWRRQSTIEMLARKENFQRSGIKTTSPKTGECFPLIEKLYLKYDAYDWNFSVNSYEKWLKIIVLAFKIFAHDSS